MAMPSKFVRRYRMAAEKLEKARAELEDVKIRLTSAERAELGIHDDDFDDPTDDEIAALQK